MTPVISQFALLRTALSLSLPEWMWLGCHLVVTWLDRLETRLGMQEQLPWETRDYFQNKTNPP